MSVAKHLTRLAVCSWSLQPKNPQDLADQLKAVGIKRTQLALDPIRENPAVWGTCIQTLRGQGIEVVSGMMCCIGEDYSTLESIRATGGLTPDPTWEGNLKNFTANAETMKKYGLQTALFHAGFLPHDKKDPNFAKMIKRLETVADVFAAKGLTVILETGQEPATALLDVLKTLNRPNVFSNLDPANMILYNQGEPVAALRTLGPYVRNLHIKDAVLTQAPGTWGSEVVVGTGQVNWKGFFQALDEIGFAGDPCIEREAGDQRVQDIRAAKQYLERLA